jgi:hypothetical protein
MARISGKSGSMTLASAAVAKFKNWSVKTKSTNPVVVDSDTAGWEDDVDGILSWEGSFEVNLDDTTVLDVEEGDTPACEFLHKTGKKLAGTVRVTGIDLGANVEGADPQAMVVSFKGKGALTRTNT